MSRHPRMKAVHNDQIRVPVTADMRPNRLDMESHDEVTRSVWENPVLLPSIMGAYPN
jgi:hypothetical protein